MTTNMPSRSATDEIKRHCRDALKDQAKIIGRCRGRVGSKKHAALAVSAAE